MLRRCQCEGLIIIRGRSSSVVSSEDSSSTSSSHQSAACRCRRLSSGYRTSSWKWNCWCLSLWFPLVIMLPARLFYILLSSLESSQFRRNRYPSTFHVLWILCVRASTQSCLYTLVRWAAAFTVGSLGVEWKWASPRVGGVVLSRLDDAGTAREGAAETWWG